MAAAKPANKTKAPGTVKEGYRRLAFGTVADAVRLIYLDEGEGMDIHGLDLFNVSEIRRVKGGVELRFYDRLDALDRLAQLEREESRGESGFYDAVRQGALSLREPGEGPPREEQTEGEDAYDL